MESESKYKVIVIGAGLSGLAAADTLLKHSHFISKKSSVLVVQAMGRVGGRTLSKEINGAMFDLGGTWVGPSHKHVMELAQKAKEELIPQYHKGKKILQFGKSRGQYTSDIPNNVNIIGLIQMQYFMWKFNRLARTVPKENPSLCPNALQWDSISVFTYIHENFWFEKVKKLAEGVVRAVFGVQPSEISFLFFLWYIHQSGSIETLININNGNQEKKLIYGSQYLSEHLKKQIQKHEQSRVLINSPVRKVTQDSQKIIVELKSGEKFISQYLIVAMPPVSVQRIQFIPKLSVVRQNICQKNFMGSIIKMLALYKTSFWKDKGFSGQTLSDCIDSPVFNAYDDTRPKQNGQVQPAIVIFANASIARYWTNQQNIKEATLKKLAQYFGKEALEPLEFHIQDWNQEQYIRGAPIANYGPGALTEFPDGLTQPQGRIHWAGTQLAFESQGFMEGAIQSGIRAANQILNREVKVEKPEQNLQKTKNKIPAYYNRMTSKKMWYNYFI